MTVCQIKFSSRTFLPDLFAVDERFHRRSPAAHFTLVSAFSVVYVKPLVQLGIQGRFIKELADFLHGVCQLFLTGDALRGFVDQGG